MSKKKRGTDIFSLCLQVGKQHLSLRPLKPSPTAALQQLGENAWLLNVKEGGLFWAILEQTNIWKFVHGARNKVIFYIFFLVKIWETNDKVKDQSKKLIFVLFCATETERKLGQITMCWKKSWDHHHLFVKGAFPQTALDVRLWNRRFCVLNISSRLGLASNAIKIMSTSGGL